MVLSTAIKKLKSIFKEHKIKPFLIAESAKELTLESKTLMIGIKWEELEGKTEAILNDLNIEFEQGEITTITLPYNYERGFKIVIDGILIIITAYFIMNEIRYCPFTKGHVNLSFPNELLENMKSRRIHGNLYFKVPHPIEDYLKATFKEDGRYNIENLVQDDS